MLITETNQIKVGMTIYGVHALPSYTNIGKAVVTSEVYIDNTVFIPVFKMDGESNIFDHHVFCSDFNVGPNGGYNNHKIFTTEREAVQYIRDYTGVQNYRDDIPIDDVTQNKLFKD